MCKTTGNLAPRIEFQMGLPLPVGKMRFIWDMTVGACGENANSARPQGTCILGTLLQPRSGLSEQWPIWMSFENANAL